VRIRREEVIAVSYYRDADPEEIERGVLKNTASLPTPKPKPRNSTVPLSGIDWRKPETQKF
jgi:hypothetical protein